MATKFKVGEKVLHGKKEQVIKGHSKNFSNNKVTYTLDSNEKVSEDSLKRFTKAPKVNSELVILQERYEELYGKPIAIAYKNKLDWISEKIKEKEDEIGSQDETEDGEDNKTPWEVLTALDEDGLADFIKAQELDIDPNDYQGLEELQTAVAEEMEIKIPE